MLFFETRNPFRKCVTMGIPIYNHRSIYWILLIFEYDKHMSRWQSDFKFICCEQWHIITEHSFSWLSVNGEFTSSSSPADESVPRHRVAYFRKNCMYFLSKSIEKTFNLLNLPTLHCTVSLNAHSMFIFLLININRQSSSNLCFLSKFSIFNYLKCWFTSHAFHAA